MISYAGRDSIYFFRTHCARRMKEKQNSTPRNKIIRVGCVNTLGVEQKKNIVYYIIDTRCTHDIYTFLHDIMLYCFDGAAAGGGFVPGR